MIVDKDALSKPFPPHLLKQKPGRGDLTYVEWVHYAHRLNDAFGPDGWSFDVLEYQLLEKEVIVRARLTAGGVTKTSMGGSDPKRNGVQCWGDEVKSAQSDALRKAASLFGIGLALWSDKREVKGATSTVEQVKELAGKAGVSDGNLARTVREDYGKGLEEVGPEALGAIAGRLVRAAQRKG
jgi:hypothetical protein